MKNKVSQLAFFVNQIDRRHIQFAYFLVMLVVSVIMQRPTDGGPDPY